MAATYIVLFTIYGAVLEYSGAGRFFIDVSFAAFGTRSAAAPGRTATLAGFLLGTVSGSGVRRAGYPPNPGGGVLSAAGIGAILSPPTLGWASSWPSRWTAAATAPTGSTSTPSRWAGCCCATATTSAR